MKTILIIDDDKSVRDSLKMILEYEHFEVEFAENGEQGLQKIDQGVIDLVLLNVKMAGMDGIETLTQLRQKNEKIPVIMIQGTVLSRQLLKRRSLVLSIFFPNHLIVTNY